MASTKWLDFSVRRDNLRECRFVQAEPDATQPQPGQTLFRVNRFAFTANNVSYAV